MSGISNGEVLIGVAVMLFVVAEVLIGVAVMLFVVAAWIDGRAERREQGRGK